MTTQKKGVMVYLPKELEAFVIKYCDDHGLSFSKNGKTAPRLGTGIVRILASLQKNGAKVTDFPAVGADSDLEAINSRLEALSREIDQLKVKKPAAAAA